jgi:hypothetical protein
VNARGQAGQVRTIPLRTQRAEGRGGGRLHFSCAGEASVSTYMVWYENPQQYDTNHSAATQFALNPAFWSTMGDLRQICERHSTVSDYVDGFQCHAGVWEGALVGSEPICTQMSCRIVATPRHSQYECMCQRHKPYSMLACLSILELLKARTFICK